MRNLFEYNLVIGYIEAPLVAKPNIASLMPKLDVFLSQLSNQIHLAKFPIFLLLCSVNVDFPMTLTSISRNNLQRETNVLNQFKLNLFEKYLDAWDANVL